MPFNEWNSRRVQVGPVNLQYRTAGTGPTVVLLHGFPQHSLMWHAIGPILAERFTVVALDQRGVGMSTITADGYDGTTMAADLKGLLDAIGVEKAFVVGYDLGALRAGINYYAAVWKDADDFAVLHDTPLTMPVLALAGEASIGPFLDATWKPVGVDVTTAVIPEAGHWISDENPAFTAAALRDFFTA